MQISTELRLKIILEYYLGSKDKKACKIHAWYMIQTNDHSDTDAVLFQSKLSGQFGTLSLAFVIRIILVNNIFSFFAVWRS